MATDDRACVEQGDRAIHAVHELGELDTRPEGEEVSLKLNDADKIILSAVGSGSGGALSIALNSANAIMSFIVLACSAIVGIYGVWKIFSDRKARRETARCDKCPDRQ